MDIISYSYLAERYGFIKYDVYRFSPLKTGFYGMSRVCSVRGTLVKLQRMTFFCRFHNLDTRYKRNTRAAQGRSYWLVETQRDKTAAVDWLALQYVTGNVTSDQ